MFWLLAVSCAVVDCSVVVIAFWFGCGLFVWIACCYVCGLFVAICLRCIVLACRLAFGCFALGLGVLF